MLALEREKTRVGLVSFRLEQSCELGHQRVAHARERRCIALWVWGSLAWREAKGFTLRIEHSRLVGVEAAEKEQVFFLCVKVLEHPWINH